VAFAHRSAALGRDQAADSWIKPRSPRRTASSRSRSIKRPSRNRSQATIRSRKIPRFSVGKRSAAFQTVRSCESESANMGPWSGEDGGCQPLHCEARAKDPRQIRWRETAAANFLCRSLQRRSCKSLAYQSSHRPDRAEELSRIASTIGAGKIWGRAMSAGDCVAAAALIMLILWGVMGILTQDKFRL
jgi:hypothetical protein